MKKNPYDLIVIKPNFIPENIIKTLMSLTDQETSKATVGHSGVLKVSEYRNTEWIPIPDEILDNFKNTIYTIHEQYFKDVFQTELRGIENPQFLKYGVGGKYDVHNDSEDWVDGKIKRIADRDITVLFYLNDDFEGGKLEFTHLGLTLKPSIGMMVAFPSYFEFSHRVYPVKSGIRYTIASWIATKNPIYIRE